VDALDWEALLRLAALHRVTPLLYFALQPHADMLPASAWGMLGAHIDKLRRRNLIMATEIKNVIPLLNEHEIVVMPFKGIPLAQRAYRSLFARDVRDLDIVVPVTTVERAREVLIGDGYRWIEAYLTPNEQRTYVARKTHYTLHHDERGIHLELHWGLMRAPDVAGRGMADLWKRARTENFLGAPTVVLAPEDELFALLLHGSKHGWSDLIWACDVAAWLDEFGAAVDWNTVYARATALDARRFVALGVLMVGALLGVTFPDTAWRAAWDDASARALMRAYTVDYFGARAAPGSLTPSEFRRQWQLRESWRTRWQYARSQLDAWQPSPRDQAFVRLPKGLHGLYALVRPVRMAVEYGGALLRGKK